MASLVSFRMEHLFGKKEVWGAVWGILRHSGNGLAAHQFVKDICAEFVELHSRKAQEFITGLVWLLLREGVACIKKGAKCQVVFVEDGFVELRARVVAAIFASGIHVCTAA